MAAIFLFTAIFILIFLVQKLFSWNCETLVVHDFFFRNYLKLFFRLDKSERFLGSVISILKSSDTSVVNDNDAEWEKYFYQMAISLRRQRWKPGVHGGKKEMKKVRWNCREHRETCFKGMLYFSSNHSFVPYFYLTLLTRTNETVKSNNKGEKREERREDGWKKKKHHEESSRHPINKQFSEADQSADTHNNTNKNY